MSAWLAVVAAWASLSCGIVMGAWWAGRDRADALRDAYRCGWRDRDEIARDNRSDP